MLSLQARSLPGMGRMTRRAGAAALAAAIALIVTSGAAPSRMGGPVVPRPGCT